MRAGKTDTFAFAKAGYEGMTYAGEPYFNHAFRVARAAYKTIPHTEVFVAGMLHDIVEDTPVTLAEIEARFGCVVAAAVDAVTRREGETYATFVRRAAKHRYGRAIKLADVRDHLAHPETVGTRRGRYVKALEVLECE